MLRLLLALLLSLSVAARADTYDARTGRLSISAVQLGDTVYRNVVVTVEKILGTSANVTTPLSEAIPVTDSYDAATRRLTIPVIEHEGKTYTNVAVTVGSVLSVGSSSPTPASSGKHLLVFASNLQATNGGGCTRDASTGCDLYSARFDRDTQTVSELTRLTSDSNAAEMFPALSPDSNWVAYDYAPNSGRDQHDLRLINLRTRQEVTLLANARFPEWVDGTHLLVSLNSTGAKDIALLQLDLTGSTPKVVGSKTLCSRSTCAGTSQTSDAFPFPGGGKVAFQSLDGTGKTAGLSTVNADGTGFAMVTGWDGSGHVIVDSTGTRLVYTTAASGAAQVIDLGSNVKATLALPSTGAAMAAYDSRYAAMVSVNWVYAAWLQRDRAIVFSAQGGDASKTYKLSRLIVGEFDAALQNPSLVDLSAAIEKAAGVSGKDFCTVASNPVKAPLVGLLGTARDDFAAARTFGAGVVQAELPDSSTDFSIARAAADAVNVKLVLSIDRSRIQTSALKFDLTRLASLIGTHQNALATPGVAALLLASDLCHVDTVTRQRKWDVTAAELSAAIGTVKALVPNLPVAIDYMKSSCLDTHVAAAAPGSSIGDVAILNFWYYKWSSTPGLLDSYATSAQAFKTFAGNTRVQVLPKILVAETVGAEASAFPSNAWIAENSAAFLAKGSAFDGVLYHDFRAQLPTQTRTIADGQADSAFVATLRSAMKAAAAAYAK